MNLLLTNKDLQFSFAEFFSFTNLKNSVSDFLSPRHCLVCSCYTGHTSKYSRFICNKCYDNMPFAESKEMILNRFHANFPDGNSAISEATAFLSLKNEFRYIEIIHALKYQKFRTVAEEFGKLLSRRLEIDSMLNYDYVVPIPIHKAKKRERGFNQSDLIGEAIARATGMKFSDKILYRHKYTITQTILDKTQRSKNMENVFSVFKNADIENKSILLIDDVLTTGSTINSAALTLLSAGASKVGAAALALAH